jgi:butyryl-CoA dehydrogenase
MAFNFSYTDEQKMYLRILKEFSKKEVEPFALDHDEEASYNWNAINKMHELGLFGVNVPKEYGGANASTLTYVMIAEELSKYCASTGLAVCAVNSLVCTPLKEYGTEEQKKKYLGKICNEGKIAGFAITEPNAGSDSINQQTYVIDEGDKYVMNGTKIFITGGDVSDFYVVIAKLIPKLGRRGPIRAFIVEKNYKGFSVGKKENKLGIRASGTAELVFENCEIPKENLIPGKGFELAMDTLSSGRISVGAQAVGIAQGAINKCVEYMKQRKQFGQSLSKFQGLQWYIAEMQTKTDAARLLVYRAAALKDEGKSFDTEASMAKYYASEVAMAVTTKAVQIFGGYGFIKDFPVERYMRDAKITEIYEGTTEIQKNIIADNIFRGEYSDGN